jgi:glycosyltransferase involved in cell wall biosynthesis
MSTKSIIISIIVPAYNVQSFIESCVESIIEQTFDNWELILVNDGSTDKTPEICDKYALNDQRIKVIHKPNGGLVSARNTGYKASVGGWVMYLDGDDWLKKNTFEELVKVIEVHNPEIVFWKTSQNLKGKVITGKAEWKCDNDEKLYINSECENLAYNTLVYSSGISTAFSKLLRRDFVDEHKLWHNTKLRQGAEGIEFSLRVFDSAKKVLFINQYFTNYRYNEDSISKRIDEKNTTYIIECFNEIHEYINHNPKKDYFLPVFYERILYILIAIAMSTYFHPKNKESLLIRIKKYKNLILNTTIFKDALHYGKIEKLDKFRKVTIYLIKYKCYLAIPLISRTKQYLLKKGIFNY